MEIFSLLMRSQKLPKDIRPLKSYLGFTDEEYFTWVSNPKSLGDIIHSRKISKEVEPFNFGNLQIDLSEFVSSDSMNY